MFHKTLDEACAGDQVIALETIFIDQRFYLFLKNSRWAFCFVAWKKMIFDVECAWESQELLNNTTKLKPK